MQKTDLNVTPYYDDFSEDSNFHRVLFRPAFSVQARELTQMQSILQNQIERLGSHFFKEGAVVIPGQAGFDVTYSFVKIKPEFAVGSTNHTIEDFRTSLIGKKLTGVTSGVIAKVVGSQAATTSDELTLFVKYESSNTPAASGTLTSNQGTTSFTFSAEENLSCDTAFSYVTSGGASRSFTANSSVCETIAGTPTGTGSSASVQKGVFYIRGSFVQTETQTIVLDAYTNRPSYRVGFQVTESLSTPEEDTSLLDNATGSTNFAAKGAHRLKYTLTLTKKAIGTADDADFIELMTINNGQVQSMVRSTEYSVLEETLARRTFDESGDYIVRGFAIDLREHFDDGLNDGVYTDGDTSKIAIGLSPGKAYVRGFEIETVGQTFVPIDKARSTAFTQNYPTTFSAGNFLQVENAYNTPDIDSTSSGSVLPFREVELRDKRQPITHTTSAAGTGTGNLAVDDVSRFPSSGGFSILVGNELINCSGVTGSNLVMSARKVGQSNNNTATSHVANTPVYAWGSFTAGSSPAPPAYPHAKHKTLGVARTRAFEHSTGTVTDAFINGAYALNGRFQHYLFDVRMLAKIKVETSKKLASNNFLTNGAMITGSQSGATGIVYVPQQDVKFTISGTVSSGSAQVTSISGGTGGIEAGMGISGTGIPDHTYIVSVDSASQVTMSANGNASGSSQSVGNAEGKGEGKKYDEGLYFHVIQTTGTFVGTDVITSNVTGDLAAGSVGLDDTTPATYFTMGDCHSVFMDHDTAARRYVADIYPADAKLLKGTVTIGANSSSVAGTNTGFTSDFKVGDLFEVEDNTGTVQRMEVKTITNDTTLETQEKFQNPVNSSTITRVRSKLEEQEELVMISKLPREAIKTLKPATLNNLVDTALTVRRQTILDFASSATATISLAEGESFTSFNIDDYQISVVGGSSAKHPVGTVLAPESSGTGTRVTVDGSSLTITLDTAGAILKVIYSVRIGTATEKTKTLQTMQKLTLTSASGGIYGTNFKDEDISLNKADIFKVRGIYERSASSGSPILPKITYGPTGGGNVDIGDLFSIGQKITTTEAGSGAVARVVTVGGSGNATNQIEISYLTDITFVEGDVLSTTQSSPAEQEIKSGGVVAGDPNILSNYTIDTGMRDTFYDIGRISRKPGIAPPDNPITIVFEYFTHGAGNYFSVDSYPVGIGTNQIDYSEIPMYSAQRVDPDVITPTGEYDLRDSVDFRPRVGDYDGTNVVAYSGTPKSISPFSFAYRNFGLTTSSLVDVPKTDATFESSFDYYLPQNGALYLDSEGNFKTTLGGAAEEPERAPVIDDAMHLADFVLPQYTFSPTDVGVFKKKNRRFTMKDIGRIHDRVENLEYYTQLNMLEKSTETFQMQDADGLDRFKNGFIVDNFTGHKVGNPMHLDYQNSMDFAKGILRPEYKSRAVELEESVSTDALRTTAGYQKTGDLLTLPYTESTFITQPYASRVENVNPFNVIAWIGNLELNPASDIWKDTNRMPNLVINREGNYDSFIARNGGKAINTVWNEWETYWTGEEITTKEWKEKTFANFVAGKGRRVMQTTTVTTTEKQSRAGVRTEVTLKIDKESKGDRVVSTDILPYCRARDVAFTGSVFKPKSRLYAFFDNVNVSRYITPDVPYVNYFTTASGTSNQDSTDITVTNVASFPSSGSISVNGETITYGGVNASTTPQKFTGCGSHSAIGDGAIVYKTPAMGDPLITGATGKHSGTFSIPDPNVSGNPAFKVGERVLRLTSDPLNGPLNGDTATSGSATYFAKGLLDHIQETIIATRNAEVKEVTLNQERTVISTRSSDRQVGWYDPVAQSFLIDEKGGAFVTSVDVYFQTKSDIVPVQCQIRTMQNGYPTTTILPFGQVAVEAADINISDDASLPTTFTFPSPVYLQQDIEYCFVILANTQDYLIWLSHMGDTEIGGTRTISDNPYAGVLFKSQNAATWTASQMEDLKFNIKRASFATNPGTITLQNKAIPSTTLGNSPITTIPGTKRMLVRHENHGMYSKDTNNVTLSNFAGSATVGGANYNMNSLNNGTSGITKVGLAEVGLDHYVIDLTGLSGAPGGNFDTLAKVTGGSGIQATENYVMDTGKVILQLLELSGTNITTKVRTTTASSASGTPDELGFSGTGGGSEVSFVLDAWTDAKEITPNENINFDYPIMVASSINENANMSNNKSFQTQITLSTDQENLSPVVDTQRMGLLTVQNRINNIQRDQDLYSSSLLDNATSTTFKDAFKPSTAASGDANAAVYITRKVTLANASTALKVIFDAVRYSSASIDVYFKTLRSDDTADFDNITWTEMTADSVITASKSRTNYREYKFEASGLDGFIAFAIKIVMRGTSSCEVPYIKDFRAIALAL